MKIYMARVPVGLAVIDEAGAEALAKIKRGDVVEVSIKQRRNMKLLRKFWKLMEVVHHNISHEQYPTKESLAEALKIDCGIRQEVRLIDGRLGFIAGSIAIDALTQAEFSDFYERCVRVLCQYFLPGMPEGPLKREVEELLGATI